jgi:hypothetical protein
MCSPVTADSFPQDQPPLFTFIAHTFQDQIAAQPPELVSEICHRCHGTIAEIGADRKRAELR